MFADASEIEKVTLSLVVYFYSVIESRAVHYYCNEDQMSDVGALAPYL